MINCPNCGTQLSDTAVFCHNCGQSVAGAAGAQQQPQQSYQPQQQYNQPYQQPYVDPKDHTGEFDAKDISDNKVMAMLPYLIGIIGIFLALIASIATKKESSYAGFHVRQALKMEVCQLLIVFIMLIGSVINVIPIVGWIIYGLAVVAAVVCSIIIGVLKIIAFFQVCKGQAKEPAIISGLNFLK